MKVLVVGGAGYVGGHLVDELLEVGHQVRVFDSLLYEEAYLKEVDFIFGDVNDHLSVNEQLKWADSVIWLAAVVGDPACALDPEVTVQTNVESVKNLVANFDGKILFPSTCSIYGAQEGLLTENSPFDPLSLYAETKIRAERVLQESGRDVLIFRLGTLFGLSDAFARLRVDLVLNVLTIRAIQTGQMSVFGGKQFRPLLHVRDVATAMIPEVNTRSTGTYNLHAENMTILSLAEKIQEYVPSAIKLSDSTFQDSRNYAVSSDLVSKDLGFVPTLTTDDGIRELIRVIGERRIPNTDLPRFSNAMAFRKTLRG